MYNILTCFIACKTSSCQQYNIYICMYSVHTMRTAVVEAKLRCSLYAAAANWRTRKNTIEKPIIWTYVGAHVNDTTMVKLYVSNSDCQNNNGEDLFPLSRLNGFRSFLINCTSWYRILFCNSSFSAKHAFFW